MLSRIRLMALLVVAGVPATASAQFGFPGMNPCNTCRQVPVAPRCAPVVPQPVTQTRIVPQVQTTYRQEQYTTYQPVTRTQVRREAVTVNVPVTTQKQVTVDEGAYKMVWVPNVVTKTVAETKLQQQVQYRDVPYQVVENVAQVHTRMVPQQTVSYRAQTVAVAKPCCNRHVMTSLPLPATTALAPIAMPQVASTVAPAPPAVSTVPQQQATVPAESENWQKVPQRQAETGSKIELQNFQQHVAVPSMQGMFSRPTTAMSALRTGRVN